MTDPHAHAAWLDQGDDPAPLAAMLESWSIALARQIGQQQARWEAAQRRRKAGQRFEVSGPQDIGAVKHLGELGLVNLAIDGLAAAPESVPW